MLIRLYLIFHGTLNLLCAVLLSAEVGTDGPKIVVIIQQYVIIDFLLLQTFIIKMRILAQKNQAILHKIFMNYANIQNLTYNLRYVKKVRKIGRRVNL